MSDVSRETWPLRCYTYSFMTPTGNGKFSIVTEKVNGPDKNDVDAALDLVAPGSDSAYILLEKHVVIGASDVIIRTI